MKEYFLESESHLVCLDSLVVVLVGLVHEAKHMPAQRRLDIGLQTPLHQLVTLLTLASVDRADAFHHQSLCGFSQTQI